mmetsp:Transcript_19654/g.45805  ORF Transcript_19654/g.45805 Transcript_19654/m.45805 type:complete len:232 (-) Transcript_19654:41-736(-)
MVAAQIANHVRSFPRRALAAVVAALAMSIVLSMEPHAAALSETMLQNAVARSRLLMWDLARRARRLTTTETATPEPFSPPVQHLCCVQDPTIKGLASVHATLPEVWNPFQLQSVNCSTVPADMYTTREGTACSLCQCLWEDGMDLVEHPYCCSVRSFGTPGIDPETGMDYCQKYVVSYSPSRQRARSCQLRYDLYPFAEVSAALHREGIPTMLIGGMLSIVYNMINFPRLL